ncbi:MAG: hypothetical protein NTW19_07105 [Planctomycetota bacterium]|nr:hypothetical protein [Planctomycetota bacterium]
MSNDRTTTPSPRLRQRPLRSRALALLASGLIGAGMLALAPSAALAQMSIGSTTGLLPAATPTQSLILGDNLASLQADWASPLNDYQTYWKSTIVGRANQAVSAAAPATFAAAVTNSSVAKAAALRYALDPSGPTAAADLAKAVAALKVAAVPGGTEITKTEPTTSYLMAYDFLRAAPVSAADRATIEASLLAVANTLGGGLSDYNVRGKVGGTRGLAGVVLGNQALLNQGLADLQNHFNYSTTNDGWFTDSQGHYLNYTLAHITAFARAYQQGSGVDLFANLKPYADMTIGMRLPNGAVPNVSNGTITPVAVNMLSAIAGPAANANLIWNLTTGSGSTSGPHAFDVTNVINNDGTFTNSFVLTDFSVAPQAPSTSPTFITRGQSGVSVFRNDWGTSSNYLMLSPGVDSPASVGTFNGIPAIPGATFPAYHSQNDTGEILVAAKGVYILAAPGYDRRDLSNSPAGYDPKRADWHNVVLVDGNVGTLPGPAGSIPNSENPLEYGGPNLGRTTRPGDFTHTSRLDSAERGNFKGVNDFSSLVLHYNDADVRRSIAFPNEDYFVVADAMNSASSHAYAFNLVGRGTQTVLTSTPSLVEVKWELEGKQVIEHLLSTHAMSLGTTQLWMMNTYNVFEQTQRMQAGISADHAGFLSLIETGNAGDPSRYNITNRSTATLTAMTVASPLDGWTDTIFAQGAMGPQSAGPLSGDAQFAYAREKAGRLDSVMISVGQHLAFNGAEVFDASAPVTLSLLLGHDGILGTISSDDLAPGTLLRFFHIPGIASATLDGLALEFTNAGGYSSVTLPILAQSGALIAGAPPAAGAPGALEIRFVPEPGSFALALGAGLPLLLRRRRAMHC